MRASALGDVPSVMVLLLRGASVHLQASNGCTALLLASHQGFVPVVRRLLAAGADPALRDEDGDTAADHAKRKGHTAVLELLRQHEVSAGADPRQNQKQFQKTSAKQHGNTRRQAKMALQPASVHDGRLNATIRAS